MNRIRNSALLLPLLMLTMASAQAAGLYKWTDDEGNVHYSQLPPAERPAQVIKPERSPQSQPVQAKAANKPENPSAPLGMTNTEDGDAKLKRQNCEAARSNLATYQSSKKVIQPDGKAVALSDEMREAKVNESKRQIEFYCQ